MSSCWFLAKNDYLSTNSIFNDLGNFSNILIPAKKASRIGLSFGSSIPYIKE
jgi:hypothetical protein